MMKSTYLFILFFSMCLAIVSAQDLENSTLFTIDTEKVSTDEFLRVYKKNLDLVKDASQKDVDNYLDLFINYKLKLREAYEQKLHEVPSYKRELKNYRQQLVKNFLVDHKVTEALVKEAYDRVTNEVKAVHILIRLQEHETDTAQAFKQISELRDRFLNEDFVALQKELHNGSTIFVEALGYFSGFKMVYDFETVAFNTKLGEVSQPFRTQFGYHIVKVLEKRSSRGEVTVAHIMVSKKQKKDGLDPEKRINDIYKKWQQGEVFESLAKQFSEDKSSSKEGGKLNAFKSGQLSSVVFEDMAFSLNKGDVSKPFETQYGWHIVKSIEKKGNPSFEEIKRELEAKVRRDSRSKLINTSLISKLKKQYNISSTTPDLSYFVSVLDATFYTRSWNAPSSIPQKTLIKIDAKEIGYKDFVNHLMKIQRKYKGKEPLDKLVNRLYNEFLDINIRSYHEDNLENENQEFAQIVSEYRDGLLLFDLMEKKIWNAAKTDSLALQDFYKKNTSNYMWEERIDAVVVTASDKKALEKIRKRLKKGERMDVIEESVSNDKTTDVIFTKDIMTKDHQLLSPDFEFKKGLSKIYKHNDAFHLVMIDDVLPRGKKTLDEARGFVVTDFQDHLEKKWLKSLRDKYKVSVDAKILNKVKEQLQK